MYDRHSLGTVNRLGNDGTSAEKTPAASDGFGII
jgi:hypothetical protein